MDKLIRMALGFVLTFERVLPAVGKKPALGKALARESDRLNSAARRKNVEPVSAFLSESQAKLIEQMKIEGFDPTSMRLPPEVWHQPANGLRTVRALHEYVSANLNDFKQPNPILRDLKAAEAELEAAEKAGVRFHFTSADV